MRKIEKDVVNNQENTSNYEKLLIKICVDLGIDNYKEVIRNYMKIKN